MMGRRGRWVIWLALVLAPAVAATTIYKYQDPAGVWHYSDQRPADRSAQVEVLQLFGSTPAQQRTVRVERRGDPRAPLLVAVNRNHAPVELRLTLRNLDNLRPARALPAHYLVPARGELPLVQLEPIAPGTTRFEHDIRWQLGDPSAQLAEDFVYLAPVPARGAFPVTQSFAGGFSHQGESGRYAIDIAMPVGTAVPAARGGTVVSVQDGFNSGGNSPRYRSQTNSIYVLHDDGSFAIYAHLKHRSALVTPGQRVGQGAIIAQSGNTCYSTAPHLHFAVLHNGGLKWRSVPFQVRTAAGVTEPRKGLALSHEQAPAVVAQGQVALGAAE
jgi:murein DD-endopeptidase MepM/ murein hydrolase activator NlpD